MKKNITYRSVMLKALALVMIVAMVCGMGIFAHARTVEKDLITLDAPINLAVSVTYTDNGTGQTPWIAIVSPNGTVYQQGGNNQNMTFEQVENILYFLIPDAQAGDWMIRFDDSFAGCLEVTTAPYSRDVVIEDLYIEELDEY